MRGVEIRPAKGLLGRRLFVDIPFRIHSGNPNWIPPLRLSVHDRLSPRHPAMAHQRVALWVAYRNGKPVGRIGACFDTLFNDYQKVKWGWVGFYDTFDDSEVAAALFEAACGWVAQQGADTCVGPANFTTNDELGLLVEGFDDPPAILTLENPPYYEQHWCDQGWEQAMDLWGWHFDPATTLLSERQRRTLERIQKRAKVTTRAMNMADFDAEVRRFFDVYNAAWSHNWGFAPMPAAEVVHIAKQLKRIINPEWAFGLETDDGNAVAVCLALPDVNQLMARVRNGRLLPTGWYTILTGRNKVDRARVWALGVRPDHQHLALGPILYKEIADRLTEAGVSAEGSWTLASNHRINNQLKAMGGRRTKVWRLYRRPARLSSGG